MATNHAALINKIFARKSGSNMIKKNAFTQFTNNNVINYDTDPYAFCHQGLLVWLLEKGFKLNTGAVGHKQNKRDELFAKLDSFGWTKFDFFKLFEHAFYVGERVAIIVNEHNLTVFFKSDKDLPYVNKVLAEIEEFTHKNNNEEIDVTYFYLRQNAVSENHIFLDRKSQETIYPQLYPTIDIANLNKEFYENKAKLLILYGAPGVGKTTFLKYLLQGRLYENIAYIKDREVMRQSEFWSRISDSRFNLIIFDDLDNALEPRKNNKDSEFVNNLLSYSDGILNRQSKIVITTNQEIESIDSALLRPGRCFDFVILPALTAEQARDIWVNVFKMNIASFDNEFGDQDEITQAALVSAFLTLEAAGQSRSYLRGEEKYISLSKKMQSMGITSGREKSGFRR